MSVNQCTFIGNLGADPESRTFQNGDKVTRFRIAVTEKFKDKSTGERREKTEWVPISAFDSLADIAAKYLRKGSKVYVQGKFETRKYQDQSGQDRYSTEVVLRGFGGTLQMLDGKGDGQSDSYGGQSSGSSQQRDTGGYGAGGSPGGRCDYDDQIPFAAEWRV